MHYLRILLDFDNFSFEKIFIKLNLPNKTVLTPPPKYAHIMIKFSYNKVNIILSCSKISLLLMATQILPLSATAIGTTC